MTGSSVQGTRLLERVFPCALSQTAPNIFAYADCNFKVQKSKENTARVVLWREFNLINSFTLEVLAALGIELERILSIFSHLTFSADVAAN